jgi:hypothetical protein
VEFLLEDVRGLVWRLPLASGALPFAMPGDRSSHARVMALLEGD